MALLTAPTTTGVKNATKALNGTLAPVPHYYPNSIDSFVSVDDRKNPWDALSYGMSGTQDKVAQAMTAAEALAAVHMDVTIEKRGLMLDDGTPMPDVVATGYYQADGGWHTMGYVGESYGIIQPAEGLSFLDNVVHDHDGAHYSSVWSARGGRHLGVTLDFPEHIVVDPGGAADTMGTYLLALNSFDGTAAFQVAVATTRFYCMNQLMPALKRAARKISIRHTAGVSGKIQAAREALGLHLAYVTALDEAANKLYAQAVTDQQFYDLVKDVLPLADDATDRQANARMDQWGDLMEAWRAPNNANITGTAWGAFNVLTEWAEWGRTVRPRGAMSAEEARANRTLAGDLAGFQGRTLAALVS